MRAKLHARKHRPVIKPLPLRPAVPGGFTKDDFDVDFETNTVTCPAGHALTFGRSLTVRFSSLCAGCPLRARCTTAVGGKIVALNDYEVELRAARRQAATA